jgi:glycerol-3-phosphate dehydrogenase
MLAPLRRADAIDRLKEVPLDVLILGGGINGAGVARDLALRTRHSGGDLRIALVERNHFASGTSGKNSQLIHGGLRYLKNLEFGLVREALRERATLLELAPHLVEPLPFLIPMYSHFSRLFYGTGLWLYDTLAGSRNIGRHRRLPLAEVKTLEPALESSGLVGGAVFFDCRVHSARFVLENIFDARRNGAVIANYVKSIDRRFEDGAWTVDLEDGLTGERFHVRARKIVDTTGPWGDGSTLRLVRGSHLVLPRLNTSDFAIAHFEPSGRIIFLIPWGAARDLTLVGTTDVDHDSGPDEVRISCEESRYLLDIVTTLYPSARGVVPVSSYSSLRPLLRDEGATATTTSREHRIWNTADGVLHISGGKYTTYRLMSEEAADSIADEIAPELRTVHLTARTPLGGNTRRQIEELRAQAAGLSGESGVPLGDVMAAVRDYGVAAPELVRRAASLASELPKLHAARIAHAVEHEMACRLYDLMFVSTYWGYEERWTTASLRPLAREMGGHLGWPEERVQEEIQAVLDVLASPAMFEASR